MEGKHSKYEFPNFSQPEIESIFIVSKPGYSSISSTIVRDIMRNNGDVKQFIPKEAFDLL